MAMRDAGDERQDDVVSCDVYAEYFTDLMQVAR